MRRTTRQPGNSKRQKCKKNNNTAGWTVSTFFVMFAVPFCVVRFSPADTGMPLCLILFYIINTIYSVLSGLFAGMDIRRRWHMPLTHTAIFMSGMWLFFNINDMTLAWYGTAYLCTGSMAMAISALKKIK